MLPYLVYQQRLLYHSTKQISALICLDVLRPETSSKFKNLPQPEFAFAESLQRFLSYRNLSPLPPSLRRIFLFPPFAPCIIWIQYFSACKWRSLNHILLRKGTPQLPAFNMRWLEFSHCTNYEGHCTGTMQPTIVWVYEQGYGARRDKKYWKKK